MTTLEYKQAAKTAHNRIFRIVNGDLSIGYRVAPKDDLEGRNVGLSFPNLAAATQFSEETGRMGWKAQCESYNALPAGEPKNNYEEGAAARRLAALPEAYGEYVESIRKYGEWRDPKAEAKNEAKTDPYRLIPCYACRVVVAVSERNTIDLSGGPIFRCPVCAYYSVVETKNEKEV